jgi:protein O-GlcNAc transferase
MVAKLAPRNPLAWRNAGVSLSASGDDVGAERCLAEAVRLAPDYAGAHHGLALVRARLGRLVEAVEPFQRAIALEPGNVEAYFNFANILRGLGEMRAAEVAFQMAVLQKPDFAAAHCNLGHLFFSEGNIELAGIHLKRAVELDPQSAEAHNNLGNVLEQNADREGALRCYDAAIACKPDFAQAICNRACALLGLGRLGEAIEESQRAIALRPDDALLHSNLLFMLLNDSSLEAKTVFDAHLAFAARFEAPLRAGWAPHANAPDPDRRLRLGYMSADFRRHAVSHFIEPILAAHDRQGFEVFAYCSHPQVDEVTLRLKAMVEHWIPCHALSDEALAARVRADGIDILVDLSGHTAHNRLPVFARKPAPVQVTWIGYAGTTGLAAMDYRITDRHLDPPGIADAQHTEKLVRLPGGNVVFLPPADAPPVNALPALSTGRVTLASLNNPRKISPAVIALWSRILAARPDARLLLGSATEESLREDMRSRFARCGVDPDRIAFEPWRPMAEFLALHHGIDLCLDPFPYNGGTTSCHALWMGVPFVTLAGDRTVSRCGAAILAQAGLEQFVAQDEDGYLERVLQVLADLPALDELRRSMRERILATPGNDAVELTRHLETAYRDMWRAWTRSGEPRQT